MQMYFRAQTKFSNSILFIPGEEGKGKKEIAVVKLKWPRNASAIK